MQLTYHFTGCRFSIIFGYTICINTSHTRDYSKGHTISAVYCEYTQYGVLPCTSIIVYSLTKNRELIVHSFTSNILNVLSKMIMGRVCTTMMGKMLVFFNKKYNNNVVDCYFFTFSEEENVLCTNIFESVRNHLNGNCDEKLVVCWWSLAFNSIWFEN